jgi:hypothetical protein
MLISINALCSAPLGKSPGQAEDAAHDASDLIELAVPYLKGSPL